MGDGSGGQRLRLGVKANFRTRLLLQGCRSSQPMHEAPASEHCGHDSRSGEQTGDCRYHRCMAASQPNAWAAFWQTLIKFEAAKLAPALAVRNTLGVVLPLIVGTAAGVPTVGIAVATGALNVAFSDSEEPYRRRAKR